MSTYKLPLTDCCTIIVNNSTTEGGSILVRMKYVGGKMDANTTINLNHKNAVNLAKALVKVTEETARHRQTDFYKWAQRRTGKVRPATTAYSYYRMTEVG